MRPGSDPGRPDLPALESGGLAVRWPVLCGRRLRVLGWHESRLRAPGRPELPRIDRRRLVPLWLIPRRLIPRRLERRRLERRRLKWQWLRGQRVQRGWIALELGGLEVLAAAALHISGRIGRESTRPMPGRMGASPSHVGHQSPLCYLRRRMARSTSRVASLRASSCRLS